MEKVESPPGAKSDEQLARPGTDAPVRRRCSRRRFRCRVALAGLVASSVLLLTACGGGGTGSAPESATTTARETGAGTTAGETTTAAAKNPGLATARYRVPTITCPSCVARVEANAEKAPGVVDAKASLETQEVAVTYDPKKTDPKRIADAIGAGGDTVKPLRDK